MLRFLFDETERTSSEHTEFAEASQSMERYLTMLNQPHVRAALSQDRLCRIEVWSHGFVDALDELEQSFYAAKRFAAQVTSARLSLMPAEEKMNYRRYMYFYKNALIRLFSLLDKTGYFINDMLELGTEKVKQRFSFFTVTRHMYTLHQHEQLEKKLYSLKLDYKAALHKLRNERNTEIHYMNAELLDDLTKCSIGGQDSSDEIENTQGQMVTLEQGYVMGCRTLRAVFDYIVGVEPWNNAKSHS